MKFDYIVNFFLKIWDIYIIFGIIRTLKLKVCES